MSIDINILDSYHLVAAVEEVVHTPSFFKDRYFPTGDGDIFNSENVIVEYKNGDEEMAPFVALRTRDIPVERGGYEMHEIKPAYIGLSRLLTADQLSQRGFGEALLSNLTPAQRAARLLVSDLSDLDKRIRRREEWMAVQTMLNNGLEMQEYLNEQTKGELKTIKYYQPGNESDHKYVAAAKWNTEESNFFGDVRAMASSLSKRGLPATDLVIGADVADAILSDKKVRELLDKNSGIIVGTINPTMGDNGVSYLGALNFGGYKLNVITVEETYKDSTGKNINLFPATSAMVTAPGCGRTMYGQITQMENNGEFMTYARDRVPKLIVDNGHDIRKIRVGSRPLTAPNNYCPWVVAEDLIG